MEPVTKVLSIGATDQLNVAGIGRDLIVGRAFGCAVATAIAATSVQDERGVYAMYGIPTDQLHAQLEHLPEARAARVGALGSPENVIAVSDWLCKRTTTTAVVDPVIDASAGGRLADDDTVRTLRDTLARLPNVVLTPNLLEAAILLSVDRVDEAERAATTLRALGARAVLLKGGHTLGPPEDVLATKDGVETFSAGRIAARMRGSGCTLAMAIACGLARGLPLRNAVASAREFVRAELQRNAGLEGTIA